MKAKQLFIILTIFFLGGVLSNTCSAQTTEVPTIPNVFTPNNDGVNDAFKIDVLGGSWRMMIFDRWGSLVFATEQGQGAAWNGINLQGNEADEGVYFYTLIDDNTGESYNGSLHLFR